MRGTLYEFLGEERDQKTRRQVVEALAGGRDRVALDFLWPSIEGTGEINPEQAAFWLAHYELHQMSEELLRQASGHPDPNVRFWLSIAALHLGELQPFVELTSQFMNGEVELQVTWGNPFELAEEVAGCGYFPEAFLSLLRYLHSEGTSTPPEDIPEITKLNEALRTKKNELNRVFLETLIDKLTPRPAASKSSAELPTQPSAPWQGSLEELAEELIQESHANRAVLVKLLPAQRTALISAWFAALEVRTAPDEKTGERPFFTGIGNPIMELPGWFWADFDPDLEQLFGTYLLLYPERTDLMMQLAWAVARAGKTRLLEEYLPLLPLLETKDKTALLHLLEKAVLLAGQDFGPIFGDGPAVSETVPEIRHFIDYKSAAIGPEEAALTLGDEEEIPRYVQAGVYDNSNKDNPERLERAFLEGKEHLLKVWIGELQKGFIAAPGPVDLGLLPDLPSWDLQIYFWEPNHAPEVQIGKLTVYQEPLPDLPVNTCEFTFTPRADLPNFQARLAVVYQKNVLQMLFLEGKVLAEAASADESDSIRFEWAEVKGLRRPDQLQEFDLVFYNEANPIQGAGLMFFGGQAGLKQVSGLELGIQEMIVALKNAGAPGAVSLEARKEDLLILANQGSMLYSAILEQLGSDSEALLHLREAQRLQLVSAVRDVFPLEMVYVYPPPGPDAVLCPNAQQAIQSGACFTCDGLSEEEAVKVVCPLGFLGLRCTIERHAIQPLQKTDVLLGDNEYLVRVGLSLGSKTINPLKSSLCATSANVTKGSKRKLTERAEDHLPKHVRAGRELDRVEGQGQGKQPQHPDPGAAYAQRPQHPHAGNRQHEAVEDGYQRVGGARLQGRQAAGPADRL